MIDNTKFKYHLGDIIEDIRYTPKGSLKGTIIGYYFVGGFNNYESSYGYCIVLSNKIITSHSGSIYGFHTNGKPISPLYAGKIIYISEKYSNLLKSPRSLILKLLKV